MCSNMSLKILNKHVFPYKYNLKDIFTLVDDT